MKFKLYSVNGASTPAILLLKNTISSSILSNQDENVELFHSNEMDSNIIHFVFHIKDEYQVGTKIGGSYFKLPISQYVNAFFHTKMGYFFAEMQNDSYLDNIGSYLETKGVFLNNCTFSNSILLSLVRRLKGSIKSAEIRNSEGEEFYGPMKMFEVEEKVNQNFEIDYLSIIADQNFISIYKTGTVSVDNSSKDYLKRFIEEVSDVLENNCS
ncbi:hypothetical protein [Brevibacillus fortis]|uniref:hypothetical protein n=1 Tax=Brevibacillus fortis TaxID=2126352 RepID=UPI0038FCBC4D